MAFRTPTTSMFVLFSFSSFVCRNVVFFKDPSETDKQELMEKTKMSLSQITVWFTNARVKMRKENKLPLNLYAKKKKKKNGDESFQLDDTLSPPFSSQNMSFNGNVRKPIEISLKFSSFQLELSTSFDTEYVSDGHLDESFPSNLVMICPSSEKQLVIAYSCLTFEQLVSRLNFLFQRRFFSSSLSDRFTSFCLFISSTKLFSFIDDRRSNDTFNHWK